MADFSYLLMPNGYIEEISGEGGIVRMWEAPGLYDELVFAGYPLHKDESKWYDACIDLFVDGDEVIAHTNAQPPHEHHMGAASGLFLAWLVRS